MMAKPLHICTPLLESVPMSKVAGCKVFIKCDSMQPSASFKIRGIGHRIQKAVQMGGKHIICSSGGNAGFAAAYAARQLGYPATIVIPESTPDFVAAGLRDEGAEVIVHGKVWDNANEYALKLAEDIEGSIVIHPFDHPDLWEGHSTVITESANQMPIKPAAVVVCVGGGGLLCGVVQGMKKVGWSDVPIVAMETKGADSYNAAVLAGELVTLPDITSRAKCLGALTVCKRSLEYSKEHPIHSVVVDDRDAVNGCLRLLDDHRILVEVACGAALAGVYSNVLRDLQKEGKLPSELKSVLVIVCGGSGITLQKLIEYQASVGL
ncbi:serine dehydratase-like [Asterias rubens]|uniref:serine dehydratase-like n=1 Tax=Asterias rubens TaxID=7604 RepID=UPI001454F281|nr:serine dehydratase-like [Asterias rubens]XP_033628326.1 serine dehydratase-like [Asterias rubens]XP_033628327.1 serine dehydratase-like [Asterias rubens]XP_033628328.1 serine dehydratase-like [Asterias rubens]XP_033628329.1 serine dehydratase-like [Asterias rubens]XP_033628332.1 serine dehydratase-like [Asterias rubens]